MYGDTFISRFLNTQDGLLMGSNQLGILYYQGKEEQREEASTPAPAQTEGSKKLTNQFNFSERASQTYNNPYRVSKLFEC